MFFLRWFMSCVLKLCITYWSYLSQVFKIWSKFIIFKKYYLIFAWSWSQRLQSKKSLALLVSKLPLQRWYFFIIFHLTWKQTFYFITLYKSKTKDSVCTRDLLIFRRIFLSLFFPNLTERSRFTYISFCQIYLWPGGFIKCISSRKFWQWFTWEVFT